jgi:alcohol dehydrogenase class IV
LKDRSSRDAAGNKLRDHGDKNSPTVPLICIPTTLSAGEYSRFGGGTSSKTHLKVVMTHPKMYPSLVILDPALTTTTPEWVWLSTGVRAIDHCVEAMCSLQSIEAVDVEAERALKLLISKLLKTKTDPTDLDARLQCQLATNYALVMLLYAPRILLACASHGIGHQLGPLGVGHGETSCILLPAVLQYNARANAQKQEKVKQIIWSDETVVNLLTKEAGLDRDTSSAGDALDAVFRALDMPRTLKDVGVGRDKLDILAENSLKDPCLAVNPIPLTEKAQVVEILEMVVGE